jgi:predicted transcriptional regulator
MDVDVKAINQRLDVLRLSRKELARRAGLHQSAVSLVLNGNTDPRLSTLRKINAALDAVEAETREQLNERAV